MRLCENETVAVYEAEGKNLAAMLREAADKLDELSDYSWATVNVIPATDADEELLLIMYVH